jgi:DNA-directed RNA polymerase subunit N (RpoN/RPB10)
MSDRRIDISRMLSKLPELDIRKGVHIKLFPDTLNSLKVLCFIRGLSIQEVYDEISQRIVSEDQNMIKILDEMVLTKKERRLKQLSSTDASAIFDILEDEDPFIKK